MTRVWWSSCRGSQLSVLVPCSWPGQLWPNQQSWAPPGIAEWKLVAVLRWSLSSHDMLVSTLLQRMLTYLLLYSIYLTTHRHIIFYLFSALSVCKIVVVRNRSYDWILCNFPGRIIQDFILHYNYPWILSMQPCLTETVVEPSICKNLANCSPLLTSGQKYIDVMIETTLAQLTRERWIVVSKRVCWWEHELSTFMKRKMR